MSDASPDPSRPQPQANVRTFTGGRLTHGGFEPDLPDPSGRPRRRALIAAGTAAAGIVAATVVGATIVGQPDVAPHVRHPHRTRRRRVGAGGGESLPRRDRGTGRADGRGLRDRRSGRPRANIELTQQITVAIECGEAIPVKAGGSSAEVAEFAATCASLR